MFPFDITDYCRLDKKLNITINLNKKMVEEMKIAFGVYYVKRLEFRETLELVKKKELIRKKKSDITKNQGNLYLNNFLILVFYFVIPMDNFHYFSYKFIQSILRYSNGELQNIFD